jgi:mannose-6-phosphate isomerase-like protein (cupin superfamily)
MNVIRIGEAPPYEAPGHNGMHMVRLQGREAGPSDMMWLGLSRIAPGGGTTLDAAAVEKFYVVWSGEVVVSNGTEEVTLKPLDSVRIAAGEARRLSNRGSDEALVLLAMPTMQPAATHSSIDLSTPRAPG